MRNQQPNNIRLLKQIIKDLQSRESTLWNSFHSARPKVIGLSRFIKIPNLFLDDAEILLSKGKEVFKKHKFYEWTIFEFCHSLSACLVGIKLKRQRIEFSYEIGLESQ